METPHLDTTAQVTSTQTKLCVELYSMNFSLSVVAVSPLSNLHYRRLFNASKYASQENVGNSNCRNLSNYSYEFKNLYAF